MTEEQVALGPVLCLVLDIIARGGQFRGREHGARKRDCVMPPKMKGRKETEKGSKAWS